MRTSANFRETKGRTISLLPLLAKPLPHSIEDPEFRKPEMNTSDIDIFREPGGTENNLKHRDPRIVGTPGTQCPCSRPDTPMPAAFSGKLSERIPHVVWKSRYIPCVRSIRKTQIAPEKFQHTDKCDFPEPKNPLTHTAGCTGWSRLSRNDSRMFFNPL